MDENPSSAASPQFSVGRRLGWVHGWNPAVPTAQGVQVPGPVPRSDAEAILRAAEPFGYLDACRLWHHLAEPVARRHEVTRVGGHVLVASADPEVVFHVSTGLDGPLAHRPVPTRTVLALLLDRLDLWRRRTNHDRTHPHPTASAHTLRRRAVEHGPFDAPAHTSVGPHSGWMITSTPSVAVQPLGFNNFRRPDVVDRIRVVVDAAEATTLGWCDGHDALCVVAGTDSPARAVADEVALSRSDRILAADLLLDLVLGSLGCTTGPVADPAPCADIGPESPIEVDDENVSCVRVTPPDAPAMYIGTGPSGLTIVRPAHSDDSGAHTLLFEVPQEEAEALCWRLGAREYAHPATTLSLYADEMLEQGPASWLTDHGVHRFSERVRVDSARWAQMWFRPPVRGHGVGRGVPGKWESPSDWTDQFVVEAVEATMDEPDARTVIGHTVFDDKTVGDVVLCAVWRRRPGEEPWVVTAYPFIGDRITINPTPSDHPKNMVSIIAEAMPRLLDSAPENDVLCVRIAAAVGEPYEAIHAGMWLALDHGIALPESEMLAVRMMIDNEFFDPCDEDELRMLFNALTARDHPDATLWDPL